MVGIKSEGEFRMTVYVPTAEMKSQDLLVATERSITGKYTLVIIRVAY